MCKDTAVLEPQSIGLNANRDICKITYVVRQEGLVPITAVSGVWFYHNNFVNVGETVTFNACEAVLGKD